MFRPICWKLSRVVVFLALVTISLGVSVPMANAQGLATGPAQPVVDPGLQQLQQYEQWLWFYCQQGDEAACNELAYLYYVYYPQVLGVGLTTNPNVNSLLGEVYQAIGATQNFRSTQIDPLLQQQQQQEQALWAYCQQGYGTACNKLIRLYTGRTTRLDGAIDQWNSLYPDDWAKSFCLPACE